jgi:hypothetical protein
MFCFLDVSFVVKFPAVRMSFCDMTSLIACVLVRIFVYFDFHINK